MVRQFNLLFALCHATAPPFQKSEAGNRMSEAEQSRFLLCIIVNTSYSPLEYFLLSKFFVLEDYICQAFDSVRPMATSDIG